MGKNKDKKNKAADTSADLGFAKPSEASAGGDGWKISKDENLGKLFLFTPLRVDQHPSFNDKSKLEDHIVADIVEVNKKDPAASELHSDAWVFPKYIQGSLREYAGKRRVLGILTKKKDPKYGTMSWMLDDASSADVELAQAYLKSIDPFEQS